MADTSVTTIVADEHAPDVTITLNAAQQRVVRDALTLYRDKMPVPADAIQKAIQAVTRTHITDVLAMLAGPPQQPADVEPPVNSWGRIT